MPSFPMTPDEAVRTWIDQYARPVDVTHLLCGRHSGPAVDYIDGDGGEHTYTFEELADFASRFAGMLREHGIGPGDRVATLLPKSPALVAAVLGIWRLGAVHVPLFTAFGPDAIQYRLSNSGARLIVADAAHESKLANVEIARVIVRSSGGEDPLSAVRAAAPFHDRVTVGGDAPFIVLYTSGTTGHPKGALIPVRALASFESYMRLGLDVRPEDVFWNAADPGWAYGLYFAIIGPLLIGHRTLLVNRPFSASGTWKILGERGVTNFAAAPTIYRALQAAHGSGEIAGHRLVRAASSAGETLNEAINEWARATLGVPVHDQYGQTELGMLVMNHQHPSIARPLRPGSMGIATPGYRLTIVDANGDEVACGAEGTLAIDVPQSPLYWFRGYYGDAHWSAARIIRGRYNVTGDIVRRDEDGFFYYGSRADDVITSAGYRIGPFEIESALMRHPAVAEAGVVGKPDPLRGESICAFVVLKRGYERSDDLASDLRQSVKTHLSAHAFPREIVFVDALPRTPSGKLQRYVLRTSFARR